MADVWYTAGTPVNLNTRRDYHYQFKIVLIGDPNVGKSSFLRRYICGNSRRNTFPKIVEDETEEEEQEPYSFNRMQLDVTQKTITRPDKVVKLTIWDTAGQERYRSLTQSYYRDARGCFILFDVTNTASFDNIEVWYKDVIKHAHENIEIIILGSKCHDLANRKITQERAEAKADHLNCKYMDMSSEAGTNVKLAFETMTDLMLAHEAKPKPTKSLVDSWKDHNHRVTLNKPETKKETCGFCSC